MNIIKISDLNIPELALYTGASENQLLSRAEPDKAVFMAEGPYVISLALDEGFEPLSVLVQENKLDSSVLQRCGDVPIYAAEKDVLEKLTGYCLTMGMVCAMRRPAPRGHRVQREYVHLSGYRQGSAGRSGGDHSDHLHHRCLIVTVF